MPIKPYLQLVRLPNVFTAAADSLAGWLLVRGSFEEPGHWLPLVGASMAIYAAGIALNDYYDYELDLAERPERPLPSGKVTRRFAVGLAAGLLLIGVILAALSGSMSSLGVSLLLVSCVVAYDAVANHTVFGPGVMGACRGLNVLLGMSQATRFGGAWAWLVAWSIAMFVVGVTWISRSETRTGQARNLVPGLILQNAAIVGLMAAALSPSRFPAPNVEQPILPLAGLIVLILVLLTVNLAAGQAIGQATPAHVQRAVKTGVLSLVWLNVGVVAAVRGVGPALAVAALWVPAFVLSRRLYST